MPFRWVGCSQVMDRQCTDTGHWLVGRLDEPWKFSPQFALKHTSLNSLVGNMLLFFASWSNRSTAMGFGCCVMSWHFTSFCLGAQCIQLWGGRRGFSPARFWLQVPNWRRKPPSTAPCTRAPLLSSHLLPRRDLSTITASLPFLHHCPGHSCLPVLPRLCAGHPDHGAAGTQCLAPHARGQEVQPCGRRAAGAPARAGVAPGTWPAGVCVCVCVCVCIFNLAGLVCAQARAQWAR